MSGSVQDMLLSALAGFLDILDAALQLIHVPVRTGL